ncbi:MAG: TetR family transcriptional regulator [Acidobacteria bacterium]|nr:TetR family transcriptional regulator [Acidobacteriota bacterium]
MTKSMKTRKLELVRDTIYDTAMGLFARKGFNEATMEEIADASGVSLRTVFRYFPTKNDLFGYALGSYGDALVAALSSASAELTPLELVRETSLAGVNFATSQPRLRLVMDITRRNRPARQAFATGLVEVEDRLRDAYESRLKRSANRHLKPRMLAFLTQMGISLAVNSWVAGEFKEPAAAHRNVFGQLVKLCVSDSSPYPEKATRGNARKNGKQHSEELEVETR